MIKKLWNVFIQTLALNFLLLGVGVAWLHQSGHIDKPRALAIRELLFPTSQPTSQPAVAAAGPATQPFAKLEALLAKHSGQRTGDQVDAIRQSLDAQSVQLDRRRREIDDLQAQVAGEQKKLADASAALEAEKQKLAGREQQQVKNTGDKGFENSLALYNAMPAKQAKSVFMTLQDEPVLRYLQAMEPGKATKIIKEFKSPDELSRVNRLMEKMRQGDGGTGPATQPAVGSNDGAEAKLPKE